MRAIARRVAERDVLRLERERERDFLHTHLSRSFPRLRDRPARLQTHRKVCVRLRDRDRDLDRLTRGIVFIVSDTFFIDSRRTPGYNSVACSTPGPLRAWQYCKRYWRGVQCCK